MRVAVLIVRVIVVALRQRGTNARPPRQSRRPSSGARSRLARASPWGPAAPLHRVCAPSHLIHRGRRATTRRRAQRGTTCAHMHTHTHAQQSDRREGASTGCDTQGRGRRPHLAARRAQRPALPSARPAPATGCPPRPCGTRLPFPLPFPSGGAPHASEPRRWSSRRFSSVGAHNGTSRPKFSKKKSFSFPLYICPMTQPTSRSSSRAMMGGMERSEARMGRQ